MRSLGLLIALGLATGSAVPSFASAAPVVILQVAPAQPAEPAGRASTMPPREILQHRPSGFWTSNRPAVGGAYRWRLLGIGALLMGVTGFLMLRALRRASADRARSR